MSPAKRLGCASLLLLGALGCGNDGTGAVGATDGGTDASGGTGTGGGSGAGGGGTGGASGAGGSGGTGAAGAGGSGGFVQQTSRKLDLLFMVDNSISMGDKQEILRDSFGELVARLTNPLCLDASRQPTSTQPSGPNESCPAGATREFAPLRDLHVGIISSSLGGHGADYCSPSYALFGPEQDDHAHLIPKVRTAVASYQDLGFFKWDPDALASPPGDSDAQVFVEKLEAAAVAVGESGCGFESQLEALYRFLVDPNPPLSVVVQNGTAVAQGTDSELLAERAAFLRPDSAVLAVALSDENDCSIMDGGVSWLAAQVSSPGTSTPFHLPRATAACATDPNSVCCRSCSTTAPTPTGCTPVSSDTGCQSPLHDSTSDAVNLRCWEQKRRFGIDFLYPVQRYVDGFTKPTVLDRDGLEQANPLFVGGRDPSLVSVGVIVGVPWQDLAQDVAAVQLELLSAADLGSLGRWNVILGEPERYVRAQDPLMIEGPDARSGTSPIVGLPLAPTTSTDPTAAPNGHEFNIPARNDLQYACIFPLRAPIDCSTATGACDCRSADISANKPLCNPPGGGPAGTTQYFAKAYPGLRELDVAKRMGERAFVASVCAKGIDPAAGDFGYRPAFGAMLARLRSMLE
jgi:hypothetical protein